MRTRRFRLLPLLLLALLVPWQAAAEAGHDGAAGGGGHGMGADVWLVLAAILVLAKVGAEVAVRVQQPPVLGELFAGIVLGNLKLLGLDLFADAASLPAVEFMAELGVVLLLFEVGLESTLGEMRKVAPQSGLVALLGVAAPMGLGYLASWGLLPDAPHTLHLFVGATLAATSVGITARVLKDLAVMQRVETRVILGAAVIDDVLGLIVLAVVSAIAVAGAPSPLDILQIFGLAFGFLAGALFLGAYVMPGTFRGAAKLQAPGMLGTLAIGSCLALAGLSAAAGLAAIVGAFAAGLVLDDVHVRPFGKRSAHDLAELVGPIVAVAAPVFFVRTGMMVDLGQMDGSALLLATALSVVAVVGKLVSGLGVRGGKGGADRMTVGIGMVPRGEVGLIFADQGARIQQNGHPLIGAGVYAAIVLMVMITTVVTPPWLAWQLRRVARREGQETVAHRSSAPPPREPSPPG